MLPIVRAEYEALAKNTTIFKREADRLRQGLQRIQRTLDILQGGDWVGEGADAFYREMTSEVLPAMQRLVSALESGARTTRAIAQVIKDLEEEMARLFAAILAAFAGTGAGVAAVTGAAVGGGPAASAVGAAETMGGTSSGGSAATAKPTLEVAEAFGEGKGYDTKWAGSGTPEAIVFRGKTILPKGEGGTYCSGYTFAVGMKSAEEHGLMEGKTVAQVRAFQKDWYGTTPESREKQAVTALENLGIGKEVPLTDARPGDFLQLWRTNGGGHSVVFKDWVQRDGQVIGIRYRSSQGSTGGMAERVEYFQGVKGGTVDRERVYVGRLSEK